MIIKFISTKIECPYCGHEMTIQYQVSDYKTNDVIYCNVEKGGCDQPFVIQNPFSITFISKILKIENCKIILKSNNHEN